MKTSKLLLKVFVVLLFSTIIKAQETKKPILAAECTTSKHTVRYDRLTTYLIDFLSVPKELEERARNVAFGGYVTREYIENALKEVHDVVRFYPCYKKEEGKPGQVYLAIKRDPQYDPANPSCTIGDNERLHISSDQFVYNRNGTGFVELNQFITTQKGTVSPTDMTKTKSEVMTDALEFRKLYTKDSKEIFSTYCFAFLRTELLCLLNNPCGADRSYQITGVRFFFGYDEEATHKLRIILLPVYKNENNEYLNLTSCKDLKDALMMQHAWPPDSQTERRNKKP